MKKGLVMEGGAMRGMFTAGVTDVLMENNIAFDGAVGVSAGAVFGCNYKSGQIGRVIRYNTRFCKDRRYCGIGILLKTGDLYSKDFAYREVPEKLDVFDTEAFKKNPMEFYVVCTDMNTAQAVYHKCSCGDREDIEWMRASASIPALSRPVILGGKELSDGGTANSVPVEFFIEKGYEKIAVILTQPKGYVKKKNRLLFLMRLRLRKYPKLLAALKNRHERYNEQYKKIEEYEKEGRIFVIRPKAGLKVGAAERNKNKLISVYEEGRRAGEECLKDLKSYLEN